MNFLEKILGEKTQEEDKIVWSTELVNKAKRAIEEGIDLTLTPFYEKNINYKKPNILYDYTEEEISEIKKCKLDVVYFANSYCFTMTDDGIRKIVLRNYQEEILRDFQSNRFVALMAARQTGKCQFVTSKIQTTDGVSCFLDCIPKNTFIGKLKYCLWRLYNKKLNKFLKHAILFLIQLIEKYEFRNIELDESDNSKKIINSFDVNLQVLTDTGYKQVNKIHQTQPYTVFELKLENGYFLNCADNHIIFNERMEEVFVSELNSNNYIQTDKGLSKVSSVKKLPFKVSMYDLTIEDENHRFYSNGILSHNTISSAIFLSWYLLFHYERNALIMANKGDTTKELMEKVRTIIENLEFFLKPGMVKKDVMGMKFDNGCRVLGQTTTKTAAIGFTVHLLYCDEFAHIPANIIEPFWRSVFPTLSSSKISRCIITSTPNGFNKFYNIYKAAEDGNSEFKAIKVHWTRVPGRDEAWKAAEISNLGSIESFNQEYECLFLASSSLLLSSDGLQRLEKNKKEFVWKDIPELEDVGYEPNDYKGLMFHPDFNPDDLKEEDRFFVWSFDVAEGGLGDDSAGTLCEVELLDDLDVKKMKSINNSFDLVCLKQVASFTDNSITPDELGKFIYHLGVDVHNQDNVKFIIEANTFGGETIRTLQNIYDDDNEFETESIVRFFHRKEAKNRSLGLKVGHDKPVFCKDAKLSLENGKIQIFDTGHIRQANTFGRNKTGSYEAVTGKDDKFSTLVNLSQFFKTVDSTELFEEFLSYNEDRVLYLESLVESKIKKRDVYDEDEFNEGLSDEMDQLFG